MKRNEVTEVKNLLPGDRFYKLNDKQKKVLEIVPGQPKKTDYQTYSVFAKAEGAKYDDPMKSSTMVVFLRHKQEPECIQSTN